MPKRTTKRSSSRSVRRQPSLKKKASFSSGRFTVFALIFALIAGFAAWKIFADSPEVQTVEAEQMVVPASGANLASDPNATPNYSSTPIKNLVKMTDYGTQLGATMYMTSPVTSVDVRAHTTTCDRAVAYMTLYFDGQKVLNNVAVTGSSWSDYKANVSFPGKTAHVLRLTFNNNPNAAACPSVANLLVDHIVVNGAVTGEPSVRIGSSPITVASGNSTSLQWDGTNITNCTANGAWSGVQNLSGPWTTPALTGATSGFGSALYKLTCYGPHGTAFGATTVNIVPSADYSSLSGLPSATTLNIDPADAAITVNGKAVTNYAPTSITGTGATFWARINPNGSNTYYYFQYHPCKAVYPPPTGGGSTFTGGCTLTDSTDWQQYPANPLPLGSGRTSVDVNTPYLTGLTPSTAYIYRVIAINNVGATTDTGYVAPHQKPTTAGTQSFYTAPK